MVGSVSPSGQLLLYQLYPPVSRARWQAEAVGWDPPTTNLLAGLSPGWLWHVRLLPTCSPLPWPKDRYELFTYCGCPTPLDSGCRQESACSFVRCIAPHQCIYPDCLLLTRPLSPALRNGIGVVPAQLDALHEDACRQQKLVPRIVIRNCTRPVRVLVETAYAR